MAKRKMLIEWPEDINSLIVKKQLEMEKKSGGKVMKPDAAIQLIRDLKKDK